MTAEVAIFKITVRQLLGPKRLVGFAALSLLPTLIFYISTRGAEPDNLDFILGALLIAPFFSIVLPVMTLVVAGSALGDERNDKTLSFLVLRPISRIGIAAAKILAAAGVASLFGVIGAVGLTGTYAVMGGEASLMLAVVVGATIACVVYSALFVLLGYVASRATLLGLLYVFLFEGTLVSLLPRLATLSPWRIGTAGMADLLPDRWSTRIAEAALGDLMPTLAGATIKTAVILIVVTGFLAILLQRRDAV